VSDEAGRTFDAREHRFGRYYDELEAGDVYRHWPGKTITEAEDHLFCLLTLAASPVHTDAHYAANAMPGGRNMVVGTYVYALLLGMSVADVSGKALAALGTQRLRHVRPVFHGDTLYAQSRIVRKRPSRTKPSVGIVILETQGFNQHEELVCTYLRSILVPRREETAEDS
jgi:acyl dehydratase